MIGSAETNASDEGTEPIARVKSVGKIAAILKLIARHDGAGIRLKTICAELGLKPASAHHLLHSLVAERLVSFDRSSKHYHLGLELVLLSRDAYHTRMAQYFGDVLERIAQRTDDAAVLYVRSGFEAICVDRAEGGYPVRAMTIKVGERRPLGFGAGPMALLAYLPDAEVEQIVKRNQRAYAVRKMPKTPSIPQQIARCRALGFVENRGLINPSISAIALPIRDAAGTVVASVSVVTILKRMAGARAKEIARFVAREISGIQVPSSAS